MPDSYTQYKNKIGLSTDGNHYLTDSREVVLVWPYKDCVLEGGQIKEDARRDEVFYNTTLAPDEIDVLTAPKALTNWKRYDKDGETQPITISKNDSLIIKGNNLLALHTLKEKYRGQVKLIYIDPPYNTGGDSFQYNDSFNHSTWLTFMKNRLEVARELLRNDGSMFIQIDDKEFGYLKVLCDEIFGRENFKESISVKNGSESGVNAINVMRGEQLFKVKEHILYYSKSSCNHRFNPLYLKAMQFNDSYRLEVNLNGNYEVTNVYKKILKEKFNQESLRGLSPTDRQIFFSEFQQYCLKNNENIYALKLDIQKSGDSFKEFAKQNKTKGIVEEYKTSDGRINLVYKGGMLSSLKKRIVSENGEFFYGTLVSDFWWDIGATPSTEGSVELKSGKKPEKLIGRILSLVTNEGDIVLDYHLGSGTTCAVAHKMNRKYIGIEQLDYGENDSVIRLRNVISGEQTGISKTLNWQGGGNFIYAELMKSNQQFIDEIQAAKKDKDLSAIWLQMQETAFLSYKIIPEQIKKDVQEFEELAFEDKQKFLIDVLDKNLLYVNQSEINSQSHHVSDYDKEMNRKFYSM